MMFCSERIANASVYTEHTNTGITIIVLSVQVVVTAKSDFPPPSSPPLSKTTVLHTGDLLRLHSPPLHSSTSCHSCPFIKQRMAQSPLATCFLQVGLKDVNFSTGTLNSFRVCYLRTVSGDTIAVFSIALGPSASHLPKEAKMHS